jgi:hypothetical protein
MHACQDMYNPSDTQVGSCCLLPPSVNKCFHSPTFFHCWWRACLQVMYVGRYAVFANTIRS